MNMDPTVTIPSPDNFIQSIREFSFQEQHLKWQSYLKQLK